MQWAQVEARVGERLAAADVRLTRGRRAALRAIASAPGPVSAAELYERMDGAVPLSSLYRTLTVLEASAVLAPHHGSRDVTRYELAEWLAGHHHHLVCDECDAVTDIELSPSAEASLHRVVAAVAADAGFDGRGHSLEISGRCEACR